MHDRAIVQLGDGVADLPHDRDGRFGRQHAESIEQIGGAEAVDVFHHEIRHAFDHVGVMDLR